MLLKCPHLSKFPSLKHSFIKMKPEDYPSPLAILKQVHGTKVYPVMAAGIKKLEGDGLVTNVKGLHLGIMTADCGPVLFYDPKVQVIGACHAGWRGARAGILQATINEMENLGAKRRHIHASLGPTIQQQYYEVGPEFPDLMGEVYEEYFYPSKKKGHHYFNLPHYIHHQLLRAGLASFHDIKCDTFSGNFSSRRRFIAEDIQEIQADNLSLIAIS
jgi:YfiH family protein